ncbi:hypothetical protein SDJN02_05659, partial [Cucurbita argyrosperma subsp. argyrosperma]
MLRTPDPIVLYTPKGWKNQFFCGAKAPQGKLDRDGYEGWRQAAYPGPDGALMKNIFWFNKMSFTYSYILETDTRKRVSFTMSE